MYETARAMASMTKCVDASLYRCVERLLPNDEQMIHDPKGKGRRLVRIDA